MPDTSRTLQDAQKLVSQERNHTRRRQESSGRDHREEETTPDADPAKTQSRQGSFGSNATPSQKPPDNARSNAPAGQRQTKNRTSGRAKSAIARSERQTLRTLRDAILHFC